MVGGIRAMTNAVYCDRCKKLFKETEIKHGILEGFWSKGLEFDFCSDCLSEVESFCYGDD